MVGWISHGPRVGGDLFLGCLLPSRQVSADTFELDFSLFFLVLEKGGGGGGREVFSVA